MDTKKSLEKYFERSYMDDNSKSAMIKLKKIFALSGTKITMYELTSAVKSK